MDHSPPLGMEAKDSCEDAPSRIVLVGLLPNLPPVTFLRLATASGTKHQQPIVVSNDSWEAGNLCSTKLDSDQELLASQR